MRQKLSSDSQGVAHIALIAVIVVVVAAVGFAAYRVMNQDKDSSSNDSRSSEQHEAEVPCESDDKDLCKFFSSWKASSQYRMTTKSDDSEAVFEVDGDKSRVSMSIDGKPYEVITIGKSTYTKAGSTWYKQTIKEAEDDVASDYKVDFEEPAAEEAKNTTTYKKLGKEACGDLTCFKYQVVDPERTDETDLIWFDDKDYQLRKSRTETKAGEVTEMTFEYDGVTVTEPSPVKELAENQYIVPGQSEPMTMPDMSKFQQ